MEYNYMMAKKRTCSQPRNRCVIAIFVIVHMRIPILATDQHPF